METRESAWMYRGFQRSVRIKILRWTLKANGGSRSAIRNIIAAHRPDLSEAEIKAAVDRWWDACRDKLEGTAEQGRTFRFML
jgi:hypothetical protein